MSSQLNRPLPLSPHNMLCFQALNASMTRGDIAAADRRWRSTGSVLLSSAREDPSSITLCKADFASEVSAKLVRGQSKPRS